MKLARNNRGDTIVEVLICIAIISLVLVVSYGTANRNYRMMLDAQEHSVAEKLMERQAELLKAYNSLSDGPVNGHDALFNHGLTNFCMVQGGSGPTTATNNGHNDGTNRCVLTADSVMAAASEVPAYDVVVTVNGAAGIGGGKVFQVAVSWDSIMGGTARETLNYGLY